LVHPAAPVLARIERMEEQVDLPGASCSFDLVGTVDKMAGAGFHSQAVERGLAQRVLGSLTEVGRDMDVIGLEGALEGGLQFVLRVRFVELVTAD
jgi:hypothetical protein